MGRVRVFAESRWLEMVLFLLSFTKQLLLETHLPCFEAVSAGSGHSGPAVPVVLWEDKIAIPNRLMSCLSSSPL